MTGPTPALHSLLSPGLVLLFFTSLSPPLYFKCFRKSRHMSPVSLRASQPQPPGPESNREDARSGFPPLSSYLASPCFASSSTAPPSPQDAARPLLSRSPCFDLTPQLLLHCTSWASPDRHSSSGPMKRLLPGKTTPIIQPASQLCSLGDFPASELSTTPLSHTSSHSSRSTSVL